MTDGTVLFRGLGFVLLVKVVPGPWPLLALFVGAVIGLGGFIFAWLDHLDGDTLWCGLALHVSMNLAWNVFSLDDAIALDWQATGLRIGTALLAVVVLSLHGRRKRAVTRP